MADKLPVADLETTMNLAKRRGFFWPSFDIYGGVAGFFDYGPLGSMLKDNILSVWKRYYVIQENCLLLDTPNMTMEDVFIASGHVNKFTDVLTRCEKCAAGFRADHLLEGVVENPAALSMDDMSKAIKESGVKCQRCGGGLSKCEEFNLMFQSSIGPGGLKKGYLRPETAQGIFINFSLLYRLAREKLPFGVVQIGKGFRNEISPRQGIIRQREFNMAECEFFQNPSDLSFPKIEKMSLESLTFVPNTDGQDHEMTIGDALKTGTLKNEALAYFVGLTKQFLVEVGVDRRRLRFRQHLQKEMAHYARDCWDAEVLTSLGWIEVVGIADRSAFDLTQHMKHSTADLRAFVKYEEPKTVKRMKVEVDRKVLGPILKGKAPAAVKALEEMDLARGGKDIELTLDGEKVTIPAKAYTVKEVTEAVHGERFVPSVIEPSYGIDRILYCVLEHSFYSYMKAVDEGKPEPYIILKIPQVVSPVKVGVFPLIAKDLEYLTDKINDTLVGLGWMTYYDTSGSIGRRYARSDEIGVPYAITADYGSKDDGKVTIRERDTTDQARVKIEELPRIIEGLLSKKLEFKSLK